MPCMSDYQEHTEREIESGKVLEFLKEVQGLPYDHDNPSYYGRVATLDHDTALLCRTLQILQKETSSEGISQLSLELQLWWKKHQEADMRRKEREREAKHRQSIKEVALSKLTDEEMEVLGIHIQDKDIQFGTRYSVKGDVLSKIKGR